MLIKNNQEQSYHLIYTNYIKKNCFQIFSYIQNYINIYELSYNKYFFYQIYFLFKLISIFFEF